MRSNQLLLYGPGAGQDPRGEIQFLHSSYQGTDPNNLFLKFCSTLIPKTELEPSSSLILLPHVAIFFVSNFAMISLNTLKVTLGES